MATPLTIPKGRERLVLQVIKAALEYFAIVFGTGTLLGPIRVLLLAPVIGRRAAELLELTIMLIVIAIAASFIVNRFQLKSRKARLAVGGVALSLGLVFEFGLSLRLRGTTVAEYFASRDPITAAAYYFTLILFGVLPMMVRQKQNSPVD